MSVEYGVNVTLVSNATFASAAEANNQAQVWLDRLAERDEADTWTECDWEIVEVRK